MKKSFVIFAIMVAFAVSASAQRVVALHSATGVSMYSGVNPFIDAYNAAQPGDTIYLSGGSFAVPGVFDKRLLIFGAGYHPTSTQATNPTLLSNNFLIGGNADNLIIEGVQFAAGISVDNNVSVSFITIKRSRINGGIGFYGDLSNPCLNNVLTECVIIGDIFLTNATNTLISNSIIQDRIIISKSNSIKNNVLLANRANWNDGVFHSTSNTEISNNVFLTTNNLFAGTADGNLLFNNVFVHPTPAFGSNPISGGNYLNVALADIFVSHTGHEFSYNSNFNLKTPAQHLGNDGKEVGIYGGLFPFKPGAIPINPYISLKNIAAQTTSDGKLSVEIKVEAQTR